MSVICHGFFLLHLSSILSLCRPGPFQASYFIALTPENTEFLPLFQLKVLGKTLIGQAWVKYHPWTNQP